MARRQGAVWLAVLILAGAYGLLRWGSGAEDRPLRADLAGLPARIDGWVAGPASPSGEVRDFGGEDVLSRGFAAGAGEPIWLYVGHWRRHREGRPIAFSPRRAYPGPEWRVVSSSLATLRGGEGLGGALRVRQVVFRRFQERQAVTYWYVQGAGRVVTEWYVGRLAMVWDALRGRRSDVALIRLASPVRGAGAAAVLARQREFAERIAPLLAAYLPG